VYLEYFSLKRHPFRITPDPTLFCPGGGRGEVLDALIYAITSGEGIVKVVGEVGSGKTMLCRILEERLPPSVEIVYLANPKLSPSDILYAIAFELKLPVQPGIERLAVMQYLQAYLLSQHAANRSVVVFIEEAQGMPVETLEEIRLLSNLETHRHKLLQIVLFGQPELDKNLRQRNIRQLKERITHSFHLLPLTTTEVSEYMRFRLQAAGCGKSGVFSSGAERLIAKVSCGLIRRINILADKAMLAAYADSSARAASGSSRAMVSSRHVRAAVRDSEFRLPLYRARWFSGLALALLTGIVVLAWAWKPLVNGKKYLGVPAVAVEVSRSEPVVAVKEVPHEEVVATTIPASGELDHAASAAVQPLPGAESVSARDAGAQGASVQSTPPVGQLLEISATTAAAPGALQVQPPLRRPDLKRAGASDLSLMAQRRMAGSQWLEKADAANYTVQLMAVGKKDEGDVEKLLRQVHSAALLENIYVCQVGELQRLVVLYNDFSELTAARKAIETLPRELRRYQPFVRCVSDMMRDSSNGFKE
jgi:MSHA biogenesis protein MshM